MISDTLRQKFIYSTPFTDDGFPLVILDDGQRDEGTSFVTVSGKSLYYWGKEDFDRFISNTKGRAEKIIILNDYELKSRNQRLEDGLKCYLLSFAYHFKKSGFRCTIR